ncbi:hypothetical protein ACJJTC_006135, partial [Scirpophaga incertulas]
MIHFKDHKNKSALSTRWAQMSKQEQIIERKKMEIQAKLEAQKQAAALAAQAKLSNPAATDEKSSANIFSNDGSFMNQFKTLLQKQQQEKKEKEQKEQEKLVKEKKNKKNKVTQDATNNKSQLENSPGQNEEKKKPNERGSRERRRWSDRGRNRHHSPITPIIDDRKDNKNIPPLMQLSVKPPDEHESEPENHTQWSMQSGSDSKDDVDNSDQNNMISTNSMGDL